MTTSPVRYRPDVEQPIENEDQIHHDLIDTIRSITETTSKDYGHAVRSVHAKAHGIVAGEFTIESGLSEELAQGLFTAPGAHPVLMRFSTNPGDILDDAVSAPRGLAIKIMEVEGERLPDAQGETTQNLVLANAPAFSAPDAKAFLGSLKQLAGTTDKAEWAKKLLSGALRGVEGAIEAVGGKSALVSNMGGTPMTHPLGDTYYSQVPFRFGDYIAKFALVPVSGNLTRLTGDKVSVAGRPDALREEIGREMIEQGGTWELRVQLNVDLDKMPVEDATAVWDEKLSPYRTIGRIVVAPQLSMGTDVSAIGDEQTFFSPWHGLAAHQPLGSINRSRRQSYEMSSQFRAKFNGCPMHDTVKLP